MEHDSQAEGYCVHVWIRGIHPMLWRLFLVRSDSTVADLHFLLQIGFDWTDFHLHTIEDVEDELDLLPQDGESRKKLLKAVREFRGYIEANQNFIPNYGIVTGTERKFRRPSQSPR